jgi:adenosine deaminase
MRGTPLILLCLRRRRLSDARIKDYFRVGMNVSLSTDDPLQVRL